ncbi:MAG: hypothetical protein V1921_04580 [Candidatus Altiarchaeota archaeon]
MENKTDITGLKKAIDSRDALELRKLSKRYSMEAVVEQSDDIINLAIISYCLNKVLSKVHFSEKIDTLIYYVREKLEKGDLAGAISSIESFDEEHGLFHGNLVYKARVKVGSRMYSSGISLTQAASLVDIKVSEILEYSGYTKGDEETRHKSLGERVAVVRRLFD